MADDFCLGSAVHQRDTKIMNSDSTGLTKYGIL